MITGKKKQVLSWDTIMSLVSEYDIFRFYLKTDFKLNHPISSPFREDENPSFSVMATKSGSLYYTDFADSKYRGTTVQLVQQLFNLNYHDALAKIDGDLGLGINGKKLDYEKVISTYKKPNIEKRDTFIQVKAKKFDYAELQYWNSYHIDIKDLKANNVYSIKKLWINNQPFPLNPNDLNFGYLLGEQWKIYRPLETKANKWKTNISIDSMWGMDNLTKKCDKIVITKALKDKMVLDKFLPNVGAVQNESTVSINNENIKLLQDNCKEVYLNFDADNAGIVNCTYYNQYGFKWVNAPKSSGVKDFADMAKVHGMEKVIEHFKSKGII